MENTLSSNQEVSNTPVEVELANLKNNIIKPEVHESFSNMIWWLFDKMKDWAGKISETGKEAFTGIFTSAKELVINWATEVKKWAVTVTEEIKNTETAKKFTATAGSATDKTISTTQSFIWSALGMVGEAIKPVIDPESAKLTAQSNIQQVEELIWMDKINNGTENHDEELLIALYYSLKDSLLWVEKPNRDSIDRKNKDIDWQIQSYEESKSKIDKINPIPTSLDKISSDAKINNNTVKLETNADQKLAA